MSTIICKSAGTPLIEKDIRFQVIFERPYYISFAYVVDNKIQIEKFNTDKEASAWSKLKKLTDHAAIVFVHPEKEKIFEKNLENLPPILIHDKLAYISVGKVLNLTKKENKQFSDAFFFRDFAFKEMEKSHPDIFFSYEGQWLLENVIPPVTAMAFLKGDGSVSIINMEKGDTFKGLWYFDSVFAKKKRAAIKK